MLFLMTNDISSISFFASGDAPSWEIRVSPSEKGASSPSLARISLILGSLKNSSVLLFSSSQSLQASLGSISSSSFVAAVLTLNLFFGLGTNGLKITFLATIKVLWPFNRMPTIPITESFENFAALLAGFLN